MSEEELVQAEAIEPSAGNEPEASAGTDATESEAPAAQPKRFLGHFESEEQANVAFQMLMRDRQEAVDRLNKAEQLFADPAVRAVVEQRRQAPQPQLTQEQYVETQAEAAIANAMMSDDPQDIRMAVKLQDALNRRRMQQTLQQEVPRQVQAVLRQINMPSAMTQGILQDPTARDIHDAAPVVSHLITKYGLPQNEAVELVKHTLGLGQKRASAPRRDGFVEGADGSLVPSYTNMSQGQWEKHIKQHWNETF